jgi:hypothetical protein
MAAAPADDGDAPGNRRAGPRGYRIGPRGYRIRRRAAAMLDGWPGRALLALLLLGGVAGIGGGQAWAAPADYPTTALADYVFGCMATNGQTQEALRRCSCSIDHIAQELPYEDYEKGETVLRLRQVPGNNPQLSMFKDAPWAQAMVDKLRKAQLDAETACF